MGKTAYYYYRDSIDIVCYIDNDETIWGTQHNGIPVYSPEILRSQKYTVIIANKRFEMEIKRQLFNDYNIKGVIVFRIEEKMQELCLEDNYQANKDEIIVAFSNGLGNQMFQYALYRNFLKQGKKVKADLSAYIRPDMMQFELLKVFPNIRLECCNPNEKEYYLKEGKVYIEEPPQGENKETYNKELLNMKAGYIEGFHCSYKYAELIRQELLEDFMFSYQNNSELCKLKSLLEEKETVAVHVRRGDFMAAKCQRELGGICTKEYYLKAIEYIKKKYSDALFCFFSNDMNWLKQNIKEENALYIEKSMFASYHDWYDMYLMSACKHNIIPNSTFGWWGAWLNQHLEKTVIGPKKWRNRWEARDWCPPEWISI